MAIKLTTSAKSSKFIKTLCYGDAGVGKTVLASTAPNVIIISAESGLLSIADKNIPVIEVSSLEDVQDAYEFVTESEDAKQFETVAVDSISEIAEVMLSKYKKEDKDARKSYGKLADHMSTLIRLFRDILYREVDGRHVYFSAKQTRLEDEYTGISTFRPAMPGKTLINGTPFFFDELLALRIGEETDDEGNVNKFRYVQTQPDMQYVAKDRSGKLDETEEPDLTKIFNKILNKK